MRWIMLSNTYRKMSALQSQMFNVRLNAQKNFYVAPLVNNTKKCSEVDLDSGASDLLDWGMFLRRQSHFVYWRIANALFHRKSQYF